MAETWDNFVKRGQLIKFRCKFDGKIRCSWDAIFHGNGKAHSVGADKRHPFLMSDIRAEDSIVKINHGVLVGRDLD